MVRWLCIDDIEAMARSVGITLTRVDEDDQRTELYIWAADQAKGMTLYVGLSQSVRADLARLSNESKWTGTTPTETSYAIGFERLIYMHDADYVRLHAEMNLAVTRDAITATWEEPYLEARELFVAEQETFLIRLHVLCGVLIGNASKAGQWESQMGSYVDKLAETAITRSGYDVWRSGRGLVPKPDSARGR